MRHGSTRGRQTGWASALAALTALAAVAQAGEARAETSPNVVRGIEVQETGDATEVRVQGSGEPTFTVFKLADPPRIVVDLAGTDVSGVERLLEVGRGNVKAVLTTQFNDAAAQVGRVMVALEADGGYDVRSEGSDVVVTVEGAAGRAETPAPPASLARVTEPVEEAPAAEAPARAPRRQAQRLPPGVVAREVDRLEEGAAPGQRLSKVVATSGEDRTTVSLVTDGPPELIETLELVDPPRLAVDLHGFTGSVRRADTRRVSRAAPLSGVRLGRHADKVRVVLDLSERPDWTLERTGDGARLVLRHARSEVRVARVEPADAEAPAAGESRVQALTYAREGGLGRAALAIEGAGRVKWQVTRPDDRTAVLIIDGATLDPELEQTFDASPHGGAVKALTAFADPGRDDRVKVVASLSKAVASKVVPTAAGLSWEFDLDRAGDDAEERDVSPAVAAGLSSEGAVHVASGAEEQRGRYTGRRVNLDFKDIDVHNVLRLLAEVSRRNIVVSDDVKGSVTLRLRNVPWDQALDLVLQSKGLDKEVMGNIIRVAPAEQLAQERQRRLEAEEANRQLEPLRVRIIPVNFASAGDVSGKVEGVLTDRGSVTVDQRTNSLIVKDIAAALERAEQLAQRLDTETPQVLIESRIVEANSNFTREVGIQWGGNVSLSPVTGNPTGLVFPNIATAAGAATDGQTPVEGTAATPNFVVNMPAAIGTNSGGGLGFVFGSVGGAVNLNLRLSALENEGVVKTISAPKVATMDNQQASISSGLSIPFSQVSAAGVNTTFIEARLQLDVTPHVTADGSVAMDIAVTNNQPNPQLTGANGQPSISKKEARTSVIVKDGETTVIGGIYTRQHSESINAVPWFSKIPVLGWLFKKKNVQEQRTELLVFITPRIINRARAIPGGAQ